MCCNTIHAIRLPGDENTIRLLSDLWTEEHVFDALDRRVKTFAGAHRFFCGVEKGIIRVYGAFYGTAFQGVCFGLCEDDPEMFVAHVAFLRDTDAAKGCLACEKAMQADYAKDGISIQRIAGYIPSYNRAAILMAKRCGYTDTGTDKTKTIVKDEYVYPCHVMIKDLR